jgi:hypothetical protein
MLGNITTFQSYKHNLLTIAALKILREKLNVVEIVFYRKG